MVLQSDMYEPWKGQSFGVGSFLREGEGTKYNIILDRWDVSRGNSRRITCKSDTCSPTVITERHMYRARHQSPPGRNNKRVLRA